MGEGSARVELAAAEPEDLPVPGQPYTFGIFRRATRAALAQLGLSLEG